MSVKCFGPIQTHVQGLEDADAWIDEMLYFIPAAQVWRLTTANRSAECPFGSGLESKTVTPEQAAEWFMQPEALDWLARTGTEFPAELAQYSPGTERNKKLLTVYEKGHHTGAHLLDVTHAQCWELEPAVSNWDSFGGYPLDGYARALYRLANKAFVLVEEYFHNDACVKADPEFAFVQDEAAADLLLANGIEPPPDLAQLVRDRILNADAAVDLELPSGAIPTATQSPREDKEALALALLLKHPDWTDTRIASEVGVARTTVYDWPRFKAAKLALKSGKHDMPKGYREEDGNLEAYK